MWSGALGLISMAMMEMVRGAPMQRAMRRNSASAGPRGGFFAESKIEDKRALYDRSAMEDQNVAGSYSEGAPEEPYDTPDDSSSDVGWIIGMATVGAILLAGIIWRSVVLYKVLRARRKRSAASQQVQVASAATPIPEEKPGDASSDWDDIDLTASPNVAFGQQVT